MRGRCRWKNLNPNEIQYGNRYDLKSLIFSVLKSYIDYEIRSIGTRLADNYVIGIKRVL